jgi:hypothetical protein
MQRYKNFSKMMQCRCQAIDLLGDSAGLMLLNKTQEFHRSAISASQHLQTPHTRRARLMNSRVCHISKQDFSLLCDKSLTKKTLFILLAG